MNEPGASPLQVAAAEQRRREALLRPSAEPLTLSEEGLRFWLDAAVDPAPVERADPARRPEIDRMLRHGLLTEAGEVPDAVRPAVDTVRTPLGVIDIEAAGRSAGHFRAWIGPECAVLFRTAPPWAATAGRPEAGRDLAIVPRDWPAVAVAHWAQITPRRVREPAVLTVSTDALSRRLADAAEPAPEGAHERLVEIWDEALISWGLRIDPVEDRLLVLDAGAAGHRQVVVDGAAAHLYALPSITLWNRVVELLAQALGGP